jgi:hypothetical protein
MTAVWVKQGGTENRQTEVRLAVVYVDMICEMREVSAVWM